MVNQKDLDFESAYVKMAYDRLEAIKEQARVAMDQVLEVEKGGTHQAKVERDVIVRSSLARLDSLDIGDQALVFGRIDFIPPAPLSEGESFHIGRVSVNSESMEPLVVDWRAPIAEAFYRATGKDPMGVHLRRHIFCSRDVVENVEDEILMRSLEDDGSDNAEVLSPSALFAAISRPRSQFMNDIVSTIQAEQDEVVRHPLSGVLVVQGAPGTGKTAVALHRAAYLMYTYRWRFERQPLLVLGPSTEFVKYISRVLPSLGESGVELHTPEGLCGYSGAPSEKTLDARRLKGDLKMVKLLQRAVKDRQRPLRKEARIAFGRKYLTVTPELSREIVDLVKRRQGPHNPKRKIVEAKVSQYLAEQYLDGGELAVDVESVTNVISINSGLEDSVAQNLPGEDSAQLVKEVAAALRKSQEFQILVERMWPRLTAEQTLHDLFSHRALLKLAGRSLLSETEIDVLAIRGDDSPLTHRWSREDAVLLDELKPLLDGQDDSQVSYGHVVVDEAQDLSPMTARLLRRRCRSGSMTVLGDLAQSFGSWPKRSWDEVVSPLVADKTYELRELSVNYRTSKEISTLADRIKNQYTSGLEKTKAIRSFPGGVELFVHRDPLTQAGRDIEAIYLSGAQGRYALLVPESDLQRSHEMVRAGMYALWSALSVLDIERVRGLEFDGVFIVRPFNLLDDSARTERALYVAVTRATNLVKIYDSEPLPDWLLDPKLT